MLKTFILILTAFFPIWLGNFYDFNINFRNNAISSANLEIVSLENGLSDQMICLPQAKKIRHFGRLPKHQTHSAGTKIAFGAEMGKYIQERNDNGNNYQLRTIVIDPGHGGKDEGCSGKNSDEKHVALKIAKAFGEKIEKAYPSLKVIYTRKTDVFVPLYKRASIANKNKADLFISLHCNSFPKNASVNGSETYVMGTDNEEENLSVAKRENQSILLEENYQQNYDGFDPNSPEGHIILSMFQNAFLEQSILFAEKVEGEIKKNTSHKSRGVKQAGFLVLKRTAMPSVLIETGFLSNSKDENYLNSSKGSQEITKAIFKAFEAYKMEVEGSNSKASIPTKYQVKKISTNEIEYKIQLASTPGLINTDEGVWKEMDNIEIRKENNNYKYMSAGFSDFNAAKKGQTRMRQLGFKDAFIVAFKNGQKMDLSEALSKG